jgi:uncharacterized protein
MIPALYVLMLLGALGALDTLYYHEWKLRLPQTPGAGPELRLHASRDFAYTLVFGSLAWITWNGLWVWPLAAVLAYEVVVTLKDFIEEDHTRRLPAGERVMHAIMGIVYGVFLTLLYPHASVWMGIPSGFDTVNYGLVSWILTAFAVGVFASGVRDAVASRKLLRAARPFL